MEQPTEPYSWAALSQPLRVAYFASGDSLKKLRYIADRV